MSILTYKAVHLSFQVGCSVRNNSQLGTVEDLINEVVCRLDSKLSRLVYPK